MQRLDDALRLKMVSSGLTRAVASDAATLEAAAADEAVLMSAEAALAAAEFADDNSESVSLD